MTQEELIKSLQAIEDLYSPEERIAILREINAAMKKANRDLHQVYVETLEAMDQEKAKRITDMLSTGQ